MRYILLLFFFSTLVNAASGAEFLSGDRVDVNTRKGDDVYIGAGRITISAPVDGDVIAAGGNIHLSDTIRQDLIVAGGEITFSGVVLDDIRVAGGRINIQGKVKGDLIIAGGEVIIGPDAEIEGDLVITGGSIINSGTVKGEMLVKGGEYTFNGTALGAASISAAELTLNGTFEAPFQMSARDLEVGQNAEFKSSFRYWLPEGEQFPQERLPEGVQATYDESLEMEDGGWGERFPWGLFIAAYLVSMLIVLMVLQLSFRKYFSIAGGYTARRTGDSLGWGFLFILGVPVLLAILFMSVIGIPLGLLGGAVYVLLLLISGMITAEVITGWIESKRGKTWNYWMYLLVAFVVFLALKLILIIPFAGFLVYLLVTALAFGGLIRGLYEERSNRA